MEGLRKTLSTSVTHTVSEEAAVPHVRGGENRSDQPWAKTTKIQYTHFNPNESDNESVPGCHNDDLFTDMMCLGTLILTF